MVTREEATEKGLAIWRRWRTEADYTPSFDEAMWMERALFAVNGLDPNRADGPEFRIVAFPSERGGIDTWYTGSLLDDYAGGKRRYWDLQDYLDTTNDDLQNASSRQACRQVL